MSRLVGADDMRARLRAGGGVSREIGRRWADDAADEARDASPVRTGTLARSFRGRPSASGASLYAVWYAKLVDAGARAHTITPRGPSLVFDGRGGNTIFAKRVRHPGMRGTRFIGRALRGAFRRTPMARTLADVWNRAA